MIADLVEGTDQIRGTYGVTHPQPRHAIAFGKGPQADHMRVVGGDFRRSSCWGKVDVGLIQHQQCRFRQRCNHPFQGGTFVPRAHRIVGVGEVDQLGLRGFGLGQQCLGVFMVAPVRDLVQDAAKARYVEIEGGIGPIRCHHRITGADKQPHQIAQQSIDPFADHDMIGRDAMVRRQSVAQFMHLGVAIHPDVGGSGHHRGDGFG